MCGYGSCKTKKHEFTMGLGFGGGKLEIEDKSNDLVLYSNSSEKEIEQFKKVIIDTIPYGEFIDGIIQIVLNAEEG